MSALVKSPFRDITFEIAENALEMARVHKTSPIPKIYEIWFSYVNGDNKELNKHIDVLLSNGEELGNYEVDQIYDEYFSLTIEQEKKRDAANKQLDKDVDAIVTLVDTHLKNGQDHADSLDKSSKDLKNDASEKNLEKVIEQLLVENSNMRTTTMGFFKDIRNVKSYIEKMHATLRQAQENEMKDALTKMPNRRFFDIKLASSIMHAHDSSSPMCLAMVDIDNFKKINDVYGHVIGDQVIKFVASLLINNIKGQDTSARYGGEEFAILLPNTNIRDAAILIENIRAKLQNSNLVLTKKRCSIGQITASFGIAEIKNSDNPTSLIERADQNLYSAKNSGKNCAICN